MSSHGERRVPLVADYAQTALTLVVARKNLVCTPKNMHPEAASHLFLLCVRHRHGTADDLEHLAAHQLDDSFFVLFLKVLLGYTYINVHK